MTNRGLQHSLLSYNRDHERDFFAGLLVGFDQTDIEVAEDSGSVMVCANITGLPEDGYEGIVVATILSIDTGSAGWSFRLWVFCILMF